MSTESIATGNDKNVLAASVFVSIQLGIFLYVDAIYISMSS